jgi:hypothetical protein
MNATDPDPTTCQHLISLLVARFPTFNWKYQDTRICGYRSDQGYLNLTIIIKMRANTATVMFKGPARHLGQPNFLELLVSDIGDDIENKEALKQATKNA